MFVSLTIKTIMILYIVDFYFKIKITNNFETQPRKVYVDHI